MLQRSLLLLLAALGACASGAPQNTASTVTVGGFVLVPKTVIWTHVFGPQYLIISERSDFESAAEGTCEGTLPDGHHLYIQFLDEQGTQVVLSPGGANASFEFVHIVNGNPVVDDVALSGSLTISPDANEGPAAGQYDVQLTSGEHLTGTFHAGYSYGAFFGALPVTSYGQPPDDTCTDTECGWGE